LNRETEASVDKLPFSAGIIALIVIGTLILSAIVVIVIFLMVAQKKSKVERRKIEYREKGEGEERII
jgi:hypothetical protein